MLLLHASAKKCGANARVYGVVRPGEKHETFWGHSRLSCPLELTLLPSDKSGHQDSTKTPLRRGSQGSAFLETHLYTKHRING